MSDIKRKPGRPSLGYTERVFFAVAQEHLEAARVLAATYGVSQAEVWRRALMTLVASEARADLERVREATEE